MTEQTFSNKYSVVGWWPSFSLIGFAFIIFNFFTYTPVKCLGRKFNQAIQLSSKEEHYDKMPSDTFVGLWNECCLIGKFILGGVGVVWWSVLWRNCMKIRKNVFKRQRKNWSRDILRGRPYVESHQVASCTLGVFSF